MTRDSADLWFRSLTSHGVAREDLRPFGTAIEAIGAESEPQMRNKNRLFFPTRSDTWRNQVVDSSEVLSSAVTLFVCLSAGFYHQPISSRYTYH